MCTEISLQGLRKVAITTYAIRSTQDTAPEPRCAALAGRVWTLGKRGRTLETPEKCGHPTNNTLVSMAIPNVVCDKKGPDHQHNPRNEDSSSRHGPEPSCETVAPGSLCQVSLTLMDSRISNTSAELPPVVTEWADERRNL